ncbi:hypothetical protein Ddc_14465 [Ditylenchus destructor]|nr:hypothetical protein Ddc_14465 [Ditylenchus destructor]
MRRSAEIVEQQTGIENETQEEPKAKKDRSHERITIIATLDNGTLVEVFKSLNYCQLAKNSLVSKKFWNLICTNRHRLALLYVDSIRMVRSWDLHGSYTKCDYIRAFNKQHSREEYNEWVIRNNYSKQSPLEVQADGRKVYDLRASAIYKDPNHRRWDDKTNVFSVDALLNHENWPVFQHFVRLLSDPFIYIRSLEMVYQTDVFSLFSQAINPDRNRLRCEKFKFHPELDSQESMSWAKDHVLCDKFRICESSDSNFDQELLNFFMTGASCTSKISAKEYDLSDVIFDFVQKFMDLKKFDENQIVQSIKSNHAHMVLNVLTRNYAEFIVKDEEDEEDETAVTIFEFVNNDIGKKMEITLETTACGSECEQETCFLLQIENL